MPMSATRTTMPMVECFVDLGAEPVHASARRAYCPGFDVELGAQVTENQRVDMPELPLPLRERQRLLTTEYERWPTVAAEWMRAGYDSPTLRDFAALSPAEGALLADVMTDVLASLGVPVRVGVPVAHQLSLLTDFEARCHRALGIVAGDATRTWGELDLGLNVYVDDHVPTVCVTVTIGGRNQPDSDTTMTLSMPDSELVAVAANGVRETLLVQFGVEWPLCAQHGIWVKPAGPGLGDLDEDTAPAWWCIGEGAHRVAVVGGLSAGAVRPPDRPALDLAPPTWW